MGELKQQLDEVAALFARAGAGASEESILSGVNPAHYTAANPFRLWVIQVVIIITMTQILALGLSKIRQPRVIAEVIGGVLLGPTAMGRIPGFSSTIFPDEAMPLLNITATIGLILFLFLVGLEIDTRMMKRNFKASATVSLAGLLFPLGLGAALGVGIYHQFIDDSVNFGHFLLFCAVAVGITAFPVLCRILTELKLLDTQVGVVVLSAGVGNDVIGWILLALTVALVNSSAGLTALYVLLVCLGFCIFLLYPVRWGYVWLAKRTGSLEQGTPTTFMMTVTLLVVFISAFFTDIIGVHAIFGGFLAGLIIPHENGFAISLVEKIEDLISILFLPLYFTLSGLRTNLGLLNDGVAWGYTVLVCLVSFASKFVACGVAALAFGFRWREAGAIGSLMSCKGLVELIVLNIGLQAGVLNQKTFAIFVVHALVLTFLTTPLTLAFYPSKYRSLAVDHDTAEKSASSPDPVQDGEYRTRFSLLLERVEELPAAMTLSQLLQPNTPSTVTLATSTSEDTKMSEAPSSSTGASIAKEERKVDRAMATVPVKIDTLRLIELTNRASAVLRSQGAEVLMYNDPILSIFRAFGQQNQLSISASLSVVNYNDFADVIAEHVSNAHSEMLLIPWSKGSTSLVDAPEMTTTLTQHSHNPFEGMMRRTTTTNQTESVVHSEFIRSVFLKCPCDVALFVERGISTSSLSPEQHLFLPFFGGPDDRLALSFLVQLCSRPFVTATVVKVRRVEDLAVSHSDEKDSKSPILPPPMRHPALSGHHHTTVNAGPDTVYGPQSTQTWLASDTADNIIWEKYTNPDPANLPDRVVGALSRITFITRTSTKPLHTVTKLVEAQATKLDEAGGRTMIVIAGRSRRMAVEDLGKELREMAIVGHGATSPTSGSGPQSRVGSSVAKTLGDVGAALVAKNVNASLLIVQAANSRGPAS
ncbi:hypothetical protein NMY22_g2626 [Coprinellus aureogranulatus]|nr:hypothetical protein NMY22_g2626 [Coprinellus aureogranulatus]